MHIMKRKHLSILFALIILIFLPTQTLAGSPTLTENETDGTVYTMSASFPDVYNIGELFEIEMKLTADVFGTLEGVIVAFYDIIITVTIRGDIYFAAQNKTLLDIDTEGGTSITTFTFNLSDIPDDNFYITSKYEFDGNNTQGADPNYQTVWGLGRVNVKEASIAIIVPILAVLSLAYVVYKKQKR